MTGGRARSWAGAAPVLVAVALALGVCADDTTVTPSGVSTGSVASPTDRPSGAPTTTAPAGTPAVVDHVIDGDTIDVEIDGRFETVRFIGIDTPEKTGGFRPAECYGDEATTRLRTLLAPGDEVRLVGDVEARDRFDRLLAYVFRASDGLFVNLEMVRDGYAAAFRYEPNTFFAAALDDAQRDARAQNLGLWGACGGPDVELPGQSTDGG